MRVENNGILLRLENNRGTKKAVAYLQQNDLALIQADSKAVLRFSNLPYLQFGTLEGNVTGISTVAENGQFLVSIAYQSESNPVLAEKVSEGMRGTATILLAEVPLISYLLSPFFNSFSVKPYEQSQVSQ